MRQTFWYGLGLLVVIVVTYIILTSGQASEVGEVSDNSYTHSESGFDAEPTTENLMDVTVGPGGQYTLAELQNWERPDGPLRVGLQVGHWQNESMPEELANLEQNGGGASWNGLSEREVVLAISQLVAGQLEAEGVVVDLLPATVPPGYIADAFVSIHADGNNNTAVNGYKFAAPRRDYAGTSQALVDALYASYGPATGLRVDPSITRRMTAYYAFNWPRYEYAVHPYTPAVIVETGFLTSPVDRRIIVDQPERSATGITQGILAFLNNTEIERTPPPLAFMQPALPLTGVVACAPLRAERQSQAERYDCMPSITDTAGATYLLEGLSTSTNPIGSEVTFDGSYRAIQTAYNYFWFPYEVTGIISDPAFMPEEGV